MKATKQIIARRASGVRIAAGLLASVALGLLAGSSRAGDMYHPPALTPGGVPAQSTITSTTITPTNATLCWYGMQGWYSVEQSTDLSIWTSLGSTPASDFAWRMTVTNNTGSTNGVFFRLNQANGFVGSGGCAGCHGDKYTKYLTTGHSSAYSLIANIPNNTSCLPCHTVGYGQPTGFTNITSTPQLANVGCENCHGPAGWHKYSDHDLVRPAKSIDPMICGGCHSGSYNPQYDEYSQSLHAQVNDDIKYGVSGGVYFTNTTTINGKVNYGYYITTNSNGSLKTNSTTGIITSTNAPGSGIDGGWARQTSCGVCHSGAARMAMIKDYEARLTGVTNALTLPTAADAAAWGPTCAVCHDPHNDINPFQLRNPTRSTNYYTMASLSDKRVTYATNIWGVITTNIAYYSTTFSSLYDPNIQVCGQCHNTRGARWDGRAYGLITNGTSIVAGLTTNITGFSRPPHHSVQYNILIGILQPDYLTTNSSGVATNYIARHGVGVSSKNGNYNTNQCATCHVPDYKINGTRTAGHTFDLDVNGCALGGCHLTGHPNIEEFQTETTNGISRVVALLNEWATNAGPALFTTNYSKYLQNAWEYTAVGELAGITNAGPSAADQLLLPDAIKQARFNVYMVLHDGSFGVHNPNYVPFLLNDAESKVTAQFPLANFKATNSTSGLKPLTVGFVSLGSGLSTYSWDFGDGNTSTLANPLNTYTNAGTYTVTLTVTDTNSVSQTLTRTAYVEVDEVPVPNFAASATSGAVPLTVTFTNLSANADTFSWNFALSKTNGAAPLATTTYDLSSVSTTYTNAGTYTVTLRAANAGGSVTQTNVSYITVTP